MSSTPELPFPTRLGIHCPVCDGIIEFDPCEDDAGSFYAEEWPACEGCNVLIEVQPISISRAPGVYDAAKMAEPYYA